MTKVQNPRELSYLEMDVLAVCAGHVRKLPYDKAQRDASKRLVSLGLIEYAMEDDQPTAYATPRGHRALRDLGK